MIPYRLTEPTDFEVLEVLSNGRRNVATNIARELDQDRPYINTRLATLSDQGLLRKVGPSDQSGLYEITPTGVAALNNRALYADDDNAFTRTVTEEAEDIHIDSPTVHGLESASDSE